MAKIYSRVTKINNVAGRSDYISNPDRQEFIKLTGKSSDFDWKEYATFEKENQKSHEKNNQARELVIALPNEMSEKFTDDVLEEFSHDLAQELLGNNRDYEFALHFNQAQTNFHMHLLFSERERVTERKPKVYKRDMWFDKTSNRMAKAHAKNAELRYKKGEVMKDKEGNIRYDDAPFTKKDKKFTERSWIKSHQESIQKVLGEYNYVLDIFDSKLEIAQKKLYKGASADYLEYADNWNQAANQVNKALKEERSMLLKEYNVLKPIMNEYQFFVGKENKMEEAELNLEIYNHNGYAGNHWNVFQRTKYFLGDYQKDKINVELFKEFKSKFLKAMSPISNYDYSSAGSFKPTIAFNKLVQKIKDFPKKVKAVKEMMISHHGTIDRYKILKQELAKKEKGKERKPKNELERRLERLRTEKKNQRKEKDRKRQTPKKSKGRSR